MSGEPKIIAGRFEVERLGGHGGMGVVYRALDRLTGRPVALKVLAPGGVADVQRFAFEAGTLATLHHDGIVKYVAHGMVDEEQPFLAMEWLEGHDLAKRLRTEPVSVADTMLLIERAAEALAAAHARNIVHRDIKPSNLFLVDGEIGRVKLLDFGIARVSGTRPTLTATGLTVGTPNYMAPEQARGDRRIDARADVFALGAVLFECLVGRPPFQGDSAIAVLMKIVLEEAPRLGQLLAGVPGGLDELVASMLASDPARRPADGKDVAHALRDLSIPPEMAKLAQPRARRGLTGDEQRMMSVILVRGVDFGPPPAEDVAIGHQATQPLLITEEEQPSSDGQQTDLHATAGSLGHLLWSATRQGALVERLLDGSAVIALPSAGATSDHTVKAARWALALRRLAPNATMALVTGRGTVSRHSPSASASIGEVVDRAVRLLVEHRDAPPGIHLDDVTANLLDGSFELVGRALLVAERRTVTAGRTLLGRASPCVGRDRELAGLRAVLDECRSESVARAVLVTAPVGVGKSRLRHEFLNSVPKDVALWSARGDSLRHGSAFALLAQTLQAAAGIVDGEPLETRREKMRSRIRSRIPVDEAEVATELLGELCGTPMTDEPSPVLRSLRNDPRLMGEQLRSSWLSWLRAEAAAHPVLIVLEDLHWGDLPTVKFLDAALATLGDLPIMVLALGRPEVHELFPGLWADRALVEVRLPGLSRRSSEALVREMLGRDAEASVVDRITEQAAGNAFFLEELIRATAEGRGEGQPETVLAMLQRRLEGFPTEARRALRAASVFGESFWLGGVVALIGGDDRPDAVTELLDDLVDREAIVRVGRGRFSGESEFAFRHALLRDSAYAMLTVEDRTLGHRLAGGWLESMGERDPVLLAEHFERGGLPERAVDLYLRAAVEAVEGHDFDAVMQRCERGVVCGAEGEVLGRLRQLQSTAYFNFRSKGEEAERYGVEALQLLPVGSSSWCKAAHVVIMAAGSLGHHHHFVSVAGALLDSDWEGEVTGAQIQVATIVGLTHVLLGMRGLAATIFDRIERVADMANRDALGAARLAYVRACRSAYFELDPWLHMVRMREAVVLARRLGDQVTVCWFLATAGLAYEAIGAFDDALVAVEESLTIARRCGLQPELMFAQSCQNRLLAYGETARDRWPVIVASQEALCTTLRERRDTYYRMNCETQYAAILVDVGRYEEAIAKADFAMELTFSPVVRVLALTAKSRALLLLGRPAEALDFANQARASFQAGPSVQSAAEVRAVVVEALHASGDPTALGAVQQARDQVLKSAALIADPDARGWYLTRVPGNSRVLNLAARIL